MNVRIVPDWLTGGHTSPHRSGPGYERMTPRELQLFAIEGANLSMHSSAVQIFKAGSLKLEHGGIDFDRIKAGIGKRLHLIPRYRQKIAWTPIENFPVWIDDPHFKLDYHVRHTSLPRLGTEEQLKRLAARIMTQRLDLSKPPWEYWIVEGLEGDRFAMINKTHHCVVDEASGIDLMQVLMSSDPEFEPPDPPPHRPRPAPSAWDLWTGSVCHRLGVPLRMVHGLEALRRESEDFLHELRLRVVAWLRLLGVAAMPATRTPINGEIGPHRAFDYLAMSLSDLKAVRRACKCTIHDVVLATATAALRDFLLARRVRPEEIRFRVMVPVEVSKEGSPAAIDQRVSGWIVQLPIDTDDPLKQLARIRKQTLELKKSRHALGVDMMSALGELTPGLVALASRATFGPGNMVLTNLPGPQHPLYLLGAEMEALYIQAPLMPNLGLAISLVSYNDRVCWGLNADSDMLPDLERLAELLDQSFRRLAAAANVRLRGIRKKRSPRKSGGPGSPVVRIH